MAKGRATSVKPIEPARRRKETVPRSEAWLARVAAGKQARVGAPLEDHAVFEPTELRADPVELLGRQGPVAGRRAPADPLRPHGVVALRVLPRGGSRDGRRPRDDAQLRAAGAAVRGRAPVSNFGFYASPSGIWCSTSTTSTRPCQVRSSGTSSGWPPVSRSRRAASPSAPRSGGPSSWARCAPTGRACGRSRRCRTRRVWYARLDAEEFLAKLRAVAPPDRMRRAEALIASAKTKDSMQAFRKLTHEVDGQPRIISDPPLIVPVEEIFPGHAAEEFHTQMAELLAAYRSSLISDRKHLFDQYRFVHMARKVVGRRQRRHPRLDPAVRGPRRAGSAVPAGQGGPVVRARAVPGRQRVHQPRGARRRRTATHAGVQRHLPRLAAHQRPRRRRPRLLPAPAARLEGVRRGGGRPARGHGRLRTGVRMDPRSRPRAFGRPRRHRRLPRQDATASTRRSPTSPPPTPTRTRRTTPCCAPPSTTAASRRRKACSGATAVQRPG